MKVLIKIGGTLIDSDDARRRLARQISEGAKKGHEIVVVHGGGKQMTGFLAQKGVESRFVGGLRVTTPETIDALLKVIAGSVNHSFVAALIGAGGQAVGLSGIDACLVEAEPMPPELGAVGHPSRCNPDLLHLLTSNGYLPIVACVGGDRQGRIYNVNADQTAVACADGFGADQLFFLTDVDGVLGPGGKLLRKLTMGAAERLVKDGIATGGMQAKLNAACEALRKSVNQIVIAPGSAPRVVQRLLSGESLGTRLVRE